MTATWPLEYLVFTDYGFSFNKNSFQSKLGSGGEEGVFCVYVYSFKPVLGRYLDHVGYSTGYYAQFIGI